MKHFEGGIREPLVVRWPQKIKPNSTCNVPVYLQKYAGAADDSHDPLFRTRPGSALRSGKWKLHEYFEDGRLELYDLDADAGERTNLAASHPEKAAELHGLMKQWRKDTGAPVPTELNPKSDPSTECGER